VPDLIREYTEGLKKSDKLLRQMLSSRISVEPTFRPAFDATFVVDKNYRYLFVNSMVTQLTGMEPEEMEGKHWSELGIPQHILGPVEECKKQAFETQKTVTVKLVFDYPPGAEVRHIEETISPLYNSAGECEALYCVAKDITSRVKAEEEISTLSKVFNQLIEKIPIGIVVVDKSCKIHYWNKAYQRSIPSLSENTYVGKPVQTLSELFGPEYGELLVVKALEGQESYGVRKTAFGREWLVHAFSLVDNLGNIIKAVGVAQDITDELILQGELSRFDRLNLVGEMAASIATRGS